MTYHQYFQKPSQISFGNNQQVSREDFIIYDVELKRYIPYFLYAGIEETKRDADKANIGIQELIKDYEEFNKKSNPYPTSNSDTLKQQILRETERLQEKHRKFLFGSDDEDETEDVSQATDVINEDNKCNEIDLIVIDSSNDESEIVEEPEPHNSTNNEVEIVEVQEHCNFTNNKVVDTVPPRKKFNTALKRVHITSQSLNNPAKILKLFKLEGRKISNMRNNSNLNERLHKKKAQVKVLKGISNRLFYEDEIVNFKKNTLGPDVNINDKLLTSKCSERIDKQNIKVESTNKDGPLTRQRRRISEKSHFYYQGSGYILSTYHYGEGDIESGMLTQVVDDDDDNNDTINYFL
uniref:Uncharacterized protein n=1 Tax=Parastrongyloides trichosuri TaxID=131310 RepID=A0A0N4ZSZ5_PARTI